MYFPGNLKKTQKNPRFFYKPQENPRTLGRVEKTQIWGENARSGNAVCMVYNMNLRVSNIRVSNRTLIYNVCPKSALT